MKKLGEILADLILVLFVGTVTFIVESVFEYFDLNHLHIFYE